MNHLHSICLRSGRPPAQDDDDWNVDLPSEDPDDGFGTVPLTDGSKTNLFHTLCRFAVISAKVYNKLYSVRAARQTDGELLSTIGELDAELEAWKDSIPLDFRPEHELTALPPHLVIHIVILHFAYYNCLTTIHRRSVHHGYWTSRLSNFATQGLNVKPLNPRVFSSAALCVSAARTSIHLIKYIPPGDYAFVWLILYYPVSSLVTIFANILQNPQDARARSDLKLIGVVTDFLSTINKEDATGSMKRMSSVCQGFERIAGLVLDKAEKDMTTRQKRKQDREREKIGKRGQEPVEIPRPMRRSGEPEKPIDPFYQPPQPAAATQQQAQQQFQSRDPQSASQFSATTSLQDDNYQQQYQQQRPQQQQPSSRHLHGPAAMSTVFGSSSAAADSSWSNNSQSAFAPDHHQAHNQQQQQQQQQQQMNYDDPSQNAFDFSVPFDYAQPGPDFSNMAWQQLQQHGLQTPLGYGQQQLRSPVSMSGGAMSQSPPFGISNDDLRSSNSAGISSSAHMDEVTETPSPDFGNMSNFAASSQFNNTTGIGSFQQPMIPQELFQMPMTFEWDWVEMMQPSSSAQLNGPGNTNGSGQNGDGQDGQRLG